MPDHPPPVRHASRSGIAQAPRLAGRGLIKAYRYSLSGLVGFHCRHLPTCSHYAEEALERFGLWAGGWMTLARLARCQPLGTAGLDLVPEALPPGSHWYLPWRYGRWRGTETSPVSRQTGHVSEFCADRISGRKTEFHFSWKCSDAPARRSLAAGVNCGEDRRLRLRDAGGRHLICEPMVKGGQLHPAHFIGGEAIHGLPRRNSQGRLQ